MQVNECPRCEHEHSTKAGVVNNRQRYRCKACGYHFSVARQGKRIDSYYVTKALQLYLEGLSYREIERVIGVSHVTVMNWVKQNGLRKNELRNYHPNYRIVNHSELTELLKDRKNLERKGMIITELGDKYMVIRWERFRD